MPFDTSNLISAETYLKDLKSSIDMAVAKLLTEHFSGGPPLTPNMTGGSLFATSHHSIGKQIDKGDQPKDKRNPEA